MVHEVQAAVHAAASHEMGFLVRTPKHRRVAWPCLSVTLCFAGGWFNFDDSRVTGPLADSEIVCSSAYLLFYRRREETRQDDGALSCQGVPAHVLGNCTVPGYGQLDDKFATGRETAGCGMTVPSALFPRCVRACQHSAAWTWSRASRRGQQCGAAQQRQHSQASCECRRPHSRCRLVTAQPADMPHPLQPCGPISAASPHIMAGLHMLHLVVMRCNAQMGMAAPLLARPAQGP